MPIRVTKNLTGGQNYLSPFVGPTPMDNTLAIPVLLSGMSAFEVDVNGVFKPGVPLTRAGTRVLGTSGTATQSYQGTGNGALSALVVGAGAVGEVFTVKLITAAANAGTFSVAGSVSGAQPNATVGVAYDSGEIAFLISDGAADFVVGDTFTITVTAPAVYGVTTGPAKVAVTNAVGDLAAAGTVEVTVATMGQVNRAILEDNLGRVLTAAEIAGFSVAGSLLKLLA